MGDGGEVVRGVGVRARLAEGMVGPARPAFYAVVPGFLLRMLI